MNATVTACLYKGCTPLHLATKYGRTDIVEALLQAGADPTVTDSEGKTPLGLAEEEGQTNIILLLAKAAQTQAQSQAQIQQAQIQSLQAQLLEARAKT